MGKLLAKSFHVLFDILSFLPTGVSNFEISLEKQRVWVESDLPSDELLATISKTGKKTSYIGSA